MDGARPRPLGGIGGPLPFTAPFIIGLTGGADDIRTGGPAATGDASGTSFLC